jgi:hypothetical protein
MRKGIAQGLIATSHGNELSMKQRHHQRIITAPRNCRPTID